MTSSFDIQFFKWQINLKFKNEANIPKIKCLPVQSFNNVTGPNLLKLSEKEREKGSPDNK